MANCELLTKIQVTEADIVSPFFFGTEVDSFTTSLNNTTMYITIILCQGGWIVIDEIRRTVRA